MNKVYEYVQKNIIEQLENAIKNGESAPWEKPWLGPTAPRNYVNQKRYRGINLLLLPLPGEYITYNQICQLQKEKKYSDIHLKKGSKSNMIIFWKLNNIDKEVVEDDGEVNEKASKYLICRYYRVFHISCVENLKPHDNLIQNVSDPVNEAEKIIERYSDEVPINKVLGSNEAYYRPIYDDIFVPDRRQFKNNNEYYSTVFHEIVHSTGHESRLARFKNDVDSSVFGSESYSKEELVAEIGSSFFMAQLQLATKDTNKNSVAYLQSWLSAIKNDVTLIVSASQKAQKACDYINNKVTCENEKQIAV